MGGINFSVLGLKKAEHKDKEGRRILDAPNISMQMLLDREVTILDIVEGVKTKHGGDRMALLIDVMGNTNKLIVNASAIKEFVHNCWERGVTKMSVAFIDRGGRRYDIDYNRANIISVQGRDIEQHGDKIVFKDNGENVVI